MKGLQWNPVTRSFVGPYGASGPNGLNFARSVSNPKSNLSLALKYIAWRKMKGDVDGVTKHDIVVHAFGKNPGKTLRGHSSNFFRIAVKCGFLSHTRKGKTVLWTIGPKAPKVDWFDSERVK